MKVCLAHHVHPPYCYSSVRKHSTLIVKSDAFAQDQPIAADAQASCIVSPTDPCYAAESREPEPGTKLDINNLRICPNTDGFLAVQTRIHLAGFKVLEQV